MPNAPLDGYPYVPDRSGNGMGAIDIPAKVLPVSKGGTGLDHYEVGDLLTANSTTSLTRLDAEPVGKMLISQGEDVMPVWGLTPITGYSGVLPPANGGTGTNTLFTQWSVVFAGAGGAYAQDNLNFNWNDVSVTLGIGGLAQPDRAISVHRPFTGGGGIGLGVAVDGVILSDTTASGASFYSAVSTQTTPFTLAVYNHFQAGELIKGVGSTITEQRGFLAGSHLVNANLNFGFLSEIPAGANRWNFYANGTAANFFRGPTSVGADPVAPMEVATKQYVDVKTAGSIGLMTQGSIPFGDASGSLIQDNANLFFNDTINALGVGGGTLVGGDKIRAGGPITGNAITNNVAAGGSIQPDVTSRATGFESSINTAAAVFTLAAIRHFAAVPSVGTAGAGSTVTSQYGFLAESTLTGGVNNYGFYGNIPAGTNRYNLYMAGTADNYIAGKLGIGSPAPGVELDINKANPGSFVTARVVNSDTTAGSHSRLVLGTGVGNNYTIFGVYDSTHNFDMSAGPLLTSKSEFFDTQIWGSNARAQNMKLDSVGKLTTIGEVRTNNGIWGNTGISPGDLTHTGYLALYRPDGTRHGYIGFSLSPSGPIAYSNDQAGGHQFAGGPVICDNIIRTGVFTFATLPSAAASGTGSRAHINDCNVTTFNTAAAGGGTFSVPVFVNSGNVWATG